MNAFLIAFVSIILSTALGFFTNIVATILQPELESRKRLTFSIFFGLVVFSILFLSFTTRPSETISSSPSNPPSDFVVAIPTQSPHNNQDNSEFGAGTYDGHWVGQTEQGLTFEFWVRRGKLQEWSVEYRRGAGCVIQVTSATWNQDILENHWMVSNVESYMTFGMIGRFDSPTEAQGVWSIDAAPGNDLSCTGEVREGWHATKQ